MFFSNWRKKRKNPKVSPIPLPKNLPKNLIPIGNELNRLHESFMWNAQSQYEAVKYWKAIYLVLGTAAAGVATFAGTKSLSGDNAQVAGVAALVSAAIGFALTALNPTRRVTQSQAVASQYQEGQVTSRQAITIKLINLTEKDAAALLNELTEKNVQLHKVADPPNFYCYWRAKISIEKKGRQTYLVDKKNDGKYSK